MTLSLLPAISHLWFIYQLMPLLSPSVRTIHIIPGADTVSADEMRHVQRAEESAQLFGS